MTAYQKLYDLYGTMEAIAEAFGITRQGVTYWKKHGVPANQAANVQKVTKGKVTILDVIQG